MPITTINGDLVLDGAVGQCGPDAYFTAKDVAEGLAAVGSTRRARIRLNSGGGIATEGMAVAAAIKAHAGGVDLVVEGIAASAATPAVCAATRATIAFGSIFMVHEASNLTIGTIAEHEASIAQLEVMNASMAGLYAAKTRQPVAAMRDLMRAETWMLAEDAVARGFCDGVVGAPGAHPIMARFDYTAYRHPPAALRAQALASRRGAAEDKAQRDTSAAIAAMCLAKGRPDMMAGLIEAGVSLAEATCRVDNAVSRGRGAVLMADHVRRQGGTPIARADHQGPALVPQTGKPTAAVRSRGMALMAAEVERQGLKART